jgi:DUF2924 family protein
VTFCDILPAEPRYSNHKGYLFRRLAWRLQSLAEGGLSERARRYARQITEDADLRLCAPRKFGGAQPPMRVAGTSRHVDPRVPAPGTSPDQKTNSAEARIADVICQRWQQYSGKTAVLEGDGRAFAEVARQRQKKAA